MSLILAGGLAFGRGLQQAREGAQFSSLYCGVGCVNGAIDQWAFEKRKQIGDVVDVTMDDLVRLGYLKGHHSSVMGEALILPSRIGESSKAVIPRPLLGCPAGTEVFMHRRGLGVRRPGSAIEYFDNSKKLFEPVREP